jgi:DNA-binding response OmpR family regulator
LTTCPCCNQLIEDVDVNMLRDVKTSLMRYYILEAMINSYPKHLTADQLIDAAYGGARIPDNVRNIISIQVGKLRDKLLDHGWTIPLPKSGRGNEAKYMLEKLSSAK